MSFFVYIDMTPCMSPVQHHGPTFGKHGLGLVKEGAEHTGMKKLQGKNGIVFQHDPGQ